MEVWTWWHACWLYKSQKKRRKDPSIFFQSVFPPLIAENLKFAHADLQRLFGKDFNSMTTNNIPEEFMDTVIDEETSLFEKWKKKKFELCSYLNKEDFPKKIIVIVFC